MSVSACKTWKKQVFIGMLFFLVAFMPFGVTVGQAALVMPDFADIPTGWITDRYEPHSFRKIGSFQGKDKVLAIEINQAEGFDNRPRDYQYTFYNTQGRQHAITGGAGSVLAAALYIPSSWGDAANGTVRTDMWGVMSNSSGVTAYPIIGYTNYGGEPRYRVYDADTGGWVNLSPTVSYDAWTNFAIVFTGSAFDYYINGVKVYSDSTISGSTGFSAVIMQAYNFFGDPSITDANPINYTAHWANSAPVPLPPSALLLGSGLLGLAGLGWRSRNG
jgi:hypothetical protein